ncbi:MAG: efflux transporter outer membrane subunit [Deltaproteobacteria bacterium]|nr:efflux transporter outer membrane subunit [Deltaproteobacteria bacterium]
MKSYKKRVCCGLLLLFVSGCMSSHPYQPPDLSAYLRDNWAAASRSESLSAQGAVPVAATAWWEQFEDPVLSGLVEKMVTSNLSLAEARERLVEARANRGVIGAGRQPAVELDGAYARAATGKDAVTYQGPPPGHRANFYQWGAAAAWEVDLWSRVAHLERAAEHDLEGLREAYHGIAVSLVSELVLAYIDYRTQESRFLLVERNLALQQRTLALAEIRQKAGTGSRLDTVRARRLFLQTRALLPELRLSQAQARHAIALLLGQTPGDLELPAAAALPALPALGKLGIPAELLVRRADIRQAERGYAAAWSRTEAARAEKYPQLSLSGYFRLQDTVVSGLFNPQAFVYSLGPGLTFPLFDGGRIAQTVALRQSQAEQARLKLEQVLLKAVKEVEDAVVGSAQTRQQLAELKLAVAAARTSVGLAQDLYAQGLGDLWQVTQSQQELVVGEESCLLAERSALAQTVSLYRALGGSWAVLELPDVTLKRSPATISAKETAP